MIEGEVEVLVNFKGISSYLKLLVLNGENNFTPLLGRPWLDVFFPDWRNFFVNSITTSLNTNQSLLNEIKNNYKDVFVKDFSTPIKGFDADLVLKSEIPIFKKAYDVPYRLRDKVLEHLTKLEHEKVITPIKTSQWASPVIVVMKKNNEIRLVIDCKVSVNKLIIPNTYPLPTAQDVFAGLAGCKVFCSLDLQGAYTQLSLSERSRKFMVINTIKGLYKYNRLPQGASSSASIFQQVMDQILNGIENVSVYLDDVLIAGKDLDDCKKKLFLVLERLQKANIKVNWDKCKFFVTELVHLGHVISENGLKPCMDKISTIENARVPRNESELKSFLGLNNYYHKFVPNLSSKLYHLYKLLRTDVKFEWNDNCNKAFEESKKALMEANFLEFYDPNKPIVIVSDASSYGLGGVIAHVIDEVEKPIYFTSFSLNAAQQKYPILHLEALALVCTVKKFHKFLYGKKFLIYTDHKPLVGIFGKQGRNSIYATKLQRFVLELAIYDFDIQYRPSKRMGNADFCSRFPLNHAVPAECDVELVNSINFGRELPLDFSVIASKTKEDAFLQNVMSFMTNGWPTKMNKQYIDVYANQQDLELVDDCLLYQNRVVIPVAMKDRILKLLHANHAGIVKMKRLARQSVYWFGINSDIVDYVTACDTCNSMMIVPKAKTDSKWIPTTRPFSRVHIDFFHFDHRTFLLLVDSYSKWVEIELMRNGTDCDKVLKKLVGLFARYGLPDVLVSDGGPPFNAQAFTTFLQRQGINVLKSPPYNPSSNGQAERLMRTVKDVLKKFLIDPEFSQLDVEDQINLFLANYRNNCITNEGNCPSKRIFSYKPKTMLDLLNPKAHYKNFLRETTIHDKLSTKAKNTPASDDIDIKDTGKSLKGKSDPFVNLTPGDEIWYKNHNPHHPAKWLKANFY